MTEVQLEPNDREDILELLDYALKKKLEEPLESGKHHWNMSGYWVVRVPQLKMIVKGYKQFSISQSSMGGLVGDIEDEINDNNS